MVLLFVLPTSLFGWGKGHEDQARLVFHALPYSNINQFWNASQKDSIIKNYSHYPDSTKKLTPRERELIGEEMCEFLDTLVPIRYKFHKDYGKAAAYLCLVKSFRENCSDSAAIFAGALLHSVADASALNHAALINYVEYLDFKNVKKPAVKFFDFSIVREHQNIEKNIYRELKHKGIAYPENLESAIFEMMMSGLVGGKFLASVEYDFFFIAQGEPTPKYILGASKLFSKQVLEGIELIESAWRFAKSQEEIDLNLWKSRLQNISKKKSACEFSKKYFSTRAKFVSERNAKDDSIFAEFFEDDILRSKKSRRVGMVVEPLLEMDESRLGFSSRSYSAMLARSLKKKGYTVRMFCLNDVAFVPNPQEIPTFIVCAQHLTKTLATRLADYRKRGGNVVFIGGRDTHNVLGLSKYFKLKDFSKVPVSKKYGKQNEDEIQGMEFMTSDGKVFKFLENPNTKNGWCKPFCDVAINADSSLTPLLFLKNKSEKFCVGAVWKSDNCGHSAFLPMYAIAPFLFEKQSEDFNWANLSLDSVGESILLKTLKEISI